MSNVTGVGSSVDYGTIASGKRINTASDDASGLAIANKLETQADALQVTGDNAKSGIGAMKVADGALGQIQDYLQNIREVSLKAMNGLNTQEDKAFMQSEIKGYLEGIREIAKDTEYNTIKLLDGSMADLDIATNPDGTGMKIAMVDATLEKLGIEGYDVTSNFDLGAIDQALEMVSDARSQSGANTNRLEQAYAYSVNASYEQRSSQSRLEDLDVPKAISEVKKNEVLEDYKVLMQKKKEEQDGMFTMLLQ